MRAAVIDDRFHKNDAKVAPFAQFLQDGTIGMGVDDGAHRIASNFSDLTNRTVSAQTELVTRHGHGHRDAFSAESFTASYFSTCSSPIIASGLINRKFSVFDKKLITSLSRVSQNRIAGGDIEMIEGGEDFRVQCLSCLDVQRLPLRFDTTEGKESREILCPLRIEEGGPLEVLYPPHEILFHGRRVRVRDMLPLLHPEPIEEGGGHIVLLQGEHHYHIFKCICLDHMECCMQDENSHNVVNEHEVKRPDKVDI
jgi:hypothetical protein